MIRLGLLLSIAQFALMILAVASFGWPPNVAGKLFQLLLFVSPLVSIAAICRAEVSAAPSWLSLELEARKAVLNARIRSECQWAAKHQAGAAVKPNNFNPFTAAPLPVSVQSEQLG